MSLQSLLFNTFASRADRRRDAAIALPGGVTECRNIAYDQFGESTLLDVYCPEGTNQPLPTIVSIHGGGYVYGSKEIYRRYGMDMARRGFAFVNFSYRLAPKWKFPTPLADTNSVMHWICKNHSRYHLDPQRIFLVGDSAGAQLASQYAAIHTNPEYAAHFGWSKPGIRILALGLNCGLYDTAALASGRRSGLALDYLGRDTVSGDPRLQVLEAVTKDFPPAFITTAYHDFLRENAQPMHQFLQEKGIASAWKCYGAPSDKHVAHVFHVNIALPEAGRCNDDTAQFFKQYL